MSLAHKKQLGVSWVQGEFTACLLIKQQWTTQTFSANQVFNLDDFQTALTQAVSELQAKDADISIVYEGHALSHPFITVPPLSYRDLTLYIANRAEQESVDDEPILYSFRKGLKQQHKEGVLLHIIHKHFVDKLIQICQQNQVFPVKLIPLSEIMNLETFRYQPRQDEVLLMVAVFEAITEILVTRGDGTVLFLRDLNHSALHDSSERLITEIKRSMLYTNQQFDVQVERIAIIGHGAEALTTSLQPHFDIDIDHTQADVDAHFWAKEAALLSPTIESNILPIQFQFERSGLRVKRALIACVSLAFIAAIALTVQTEMRIQDEASKSKAINQGLKPLLTRQANLSRQIFDIESVDKRTQELMRTQTYPTAAWFLAKLPSLMPQDLRLTDSFIQHQDNHWFFSLQGTALKEASLAPQQLTILENNIMALPLTATITQSWKATWFQNIQTGEHNTQNTAFEIQGTLQ